ncbi:hypothetical protein BD310DRAFT_170634 [Dichomitus squalens]|uniref:Uncharacterized protein n=1 Tax=Dichomitus squalens TaxID=114155 RepID=A0A4Q9PHN9_9APHY|nr:hypothetical protein BD310DRAFT_170634 [Dichomitus squalens]
MRMVQLAYARHPGSGSRILSHQRPLRRSLSHDSLPLSGCFRRGPGARSLARVRSGDSDDAQARRKYGGRRRTCPHCGGGMWTLSRPSATRRERGTAAYARPACFGTLPRLPAIAPRPRAVQASNCHLHPRTSNPRRHQHCHDACSAVADPPRLDLCEWAAFRRSSSPCISISANGALDRQRGIRLAFVRERVPRGDVSAPYT